jgi:hypothetical protein
MLPPCSTYDWRECDALVFDLPSLSSGPIETSFAWTLRCGCTWYHSVEHATTSRSIKIDINRDDRKKTYRKVMISKMLNHSPEFPSQGTHFDHVKRRVEQCTGSAGLATAST